MEMEERLKTTGQIVDDLQVQCVGGLAHRQVRCSQSCVWIVCRAVFLFFCSQHINTIQRELNTQVHDQQEGLDTITGNIDQVTPGSALHCTALPPSPPSSLHLHCRRC